MSKYKKLTTSQLIAKADQLEEAGAINEAFKCWEAIIKRESDAVYFCRFGQLAMKLEKLSVAEDAFMSAIALAPGLHNPFNLLGLLNLKRGNLETAYTCFKESLRINERAPTLTFLGNLLIKLNKKEEAINSLRKAIYLDPDYEEAYYNLATIILDESPLEAMALLQKATALDPNYALAHRELGWCFRTLGQLPEGLHHLYKAIELDGSDWWSYIYLGNTLWTTGDLSSADAAFQKAIKLSPNECTVYWCYALFLEYEKRTGEAEELYQRGFELNPDDTMLNLRFGLFLKETGRPERAKAHLERILGSDPTNNRAKQALADLS